MSYLIIVFYFLQLHFFISFFFFDDFCDLRKSLILPVHGMLLVPNFLYAKQNLGPVTLASSGPNRARIKEGLKITFILKQLRFRQGKVRLGCNVLESGQSSPWPFLTYQPNGNSPTTCSLYLASILSTNASKHFPPLVPSKPKRSLQLPVSCSAQS